MNYGDMEYNLLRYKAELKEREHAIRQFQRKIVQESAQVKELRFIVNLLDDIIKSSKSAIDLDINLN